MNSFNLPTDLNTLIPNIVNNMPITDSTLDDIIEVSKIVEWGKIKGTINKQKDLIELLNSLKDDVEQEIKDKTSVIFHYKGNVVNLEELNAIETKEVGDVYNVVDTGANYAWDGTGWDKLSETVDLSGLVAIQDFENAINNIYTKEQVDALITAINTAIAAYKADKETTYTKEELDGLLADEVSARQGADADLQDAIGSCYTKEESDNLFIKDISDKADEMALQLEIENRISADELLQVDINRKTDKEITSANGKALIFNESDGGGAKFEGVERNSFAGVNDMTDPNHLGVQLYNIDKTTKVGPRINLTSDRATYSVDKTEVGADYELVIKKDISGKADISNVYTKLEADEKFLTEHQDITGKQDIIRDLAEIRGKASTALQAGDNISELVNDAGFVNESLVDEKIQAVVGSAPETLDTLEEIATRLEDGTIASQIAELQNKLHRLETYVDHYLILTPEQEQQVANTEAIQNALTTGKTVTIEEGTVCDIVVPEVNGAVTINAPLDENTSIDLTSPKGVTLNNTGESTVNLNINAPANGSTPTVTLTGNYGTVEVENASIKVNDGSVQEVVITEDNTKNTSIGGTFATDMSIQSNSSADLSISNDNEDDTVNLDLDAPNSTVSLFKTYNSVNSTVGDNTLIIVPSAHIGTLTVEKGNVIVKDRDVANRINTVINETEEYTVLPYTVEVNEWTDLTGITSNAGKYIINEDIIAENKNLTYGVFGSGNCEIDLNNHSLKFGRSSNGLVFIRGTVSFNVVGNGYVENTSDSYGIWLSSETSEVNIYGGTWLASTHCMYAEKGTINIYGGEFKIKDEDKKFLLNCLDASYTSGKAHINVYGGKFYGFNPAQSMGEPGGPVSFVAPGYHVVETVVDNETVYEVVAD